MNNLSAYINVKYFKYIIFSLFLVSKMYGQYPCQGCIVGNIGEERHGSSEPVRARYHYGIDFAQTNGTIVTAIETGPFIWDSRKKIFAIGTYGYVHVDIDQAIKNIVNGTIVQQGTVIGTISNGAGHLHLQKASAVISNGTNSQQDIQRLESTNTIDWINYIIGVGRTGGSTPVIDDVTLFRQQTSVGTPITSNPVSLNNKPKLYGKYDILVNSTEHVGNYRLAPYKMEYKITDNYGNLLNDWTGIEFKKVPLNSSGLHVMGIKSNYVNKDFEYIITNDPFTMPFDKSLNTRKHGISYNSTDFPLAAKYKDGTKLRIFVRSCDESNNCANEILIPTSTGVYEVDNFQPYIENVNVKFANRKLYTLNRFAASLSTENSGFLKNKISKRAFIPSPGSEIELTVNTSEVLSELKIGYNLNSDGLPSNYYDMTQSMNNKLVWSYKFRPPLLNDKDFYFFTFKGKDISTNEIVDVYWSSLQNGNTSVPIPCRINNVGTEWTNVPSIAPGKDHVKVPFNFCGRSMQNDENCKVLENLESSLTYNSCKDATISLHAQNFDPANFLITWSDEAGNILKDYNDKNIISITTPGTYCYKIEAIDDCCSMEGCVEVIEDNMINSIATTGEVIYATCNKSVDIKTNLVASDNNKPYTYRWSTGSDKDAITVDNGGSYCVTVTGNNGCSNSMCFDIEDRKINITGNPDPICQQGTGSISPTVTGGTEPYSFEWSNGETTQEIFDLPLGTYYLLVEDANGCWENAEFEVKLNDKIVEVSHFENLQDCSDHKGSISINPLVNDNIRYAWYDSEGTLISTNKDLENLPVGTYNLVATNESGCETSLSQAICCCDLGLMTDNPATCYIGYHKELSAVGTVQHTTLGLNNGSISLLVQGGKGQIILNWTGPNGFTSTSPNITNLGNGTYTVSITDGCEDLVLSFVVTNGIICQNANIQIEGKTTCIEPNKPGKIDITVSGGTAPYTYQWQTDGSTNEDYTSSYSGSSVFVTDKNGCTATKYFNLRYVNPLKIEIEETKCVTGMPITPGNLKVTATGGLDNRYLWSDGSTSQNIPTTSAGTYTVSVSNDCGQSVSLSTVVTCTGTPPSAATVCIDILFISYDYTKEKLVVTLQDKSILPQGICTIKLQDNKTGGPSVFVNVTFEPGQNLYLIGLKRESLPNGSYSASITQNSQSCLALTPNMEISDPPSTTDNCYTNLLLDSKMLNYTTNKKGNEVEIIIIDENGKETKIKEKFSTSGTGVIDLSAYLSWSTYAIIINVSGCPEITISGSNFCSDDPKSIVYEPSEDKFIYFYTKSDNSMQVHSNWVSPVTYQSVQEFLTWTCEDIIIKDIKVDEQYNVYVTGLDIQTQTKTRIIKYNWSTQQVIWSQWIETFIYESVLLNTQQNLIMVAGYDTVINQWRIVQYNKSNGDIVSTQPFPNKCGVTKGKFDCSYLTMHRDNIYTYFENFQLRYESPNTNWVAPLPPTVKVRKVDILHSNGVVVGGDFEGSIIIDGISYSSGTYRGIIVIVFNQFGRVETVKVFKSSKHRVLKSFTTDGYYNLAYIGYNTENINIGQSTLLDLTAMANHPDVCAETGGIKLNNLGLRNKSGENLSPDVRFYPNPFSKGINLSLDAIKEEAVTIKAYNNVGHLVFEDILHVQQGKNVAYLEAFEKLPPGVYVVKLNSLTMEHVSRIIRIE